VITSSDGAGTNAVVVARASVRLTTRGAAGATGVTGGTACADADATGSGCIAGASPTAGPFTGAAGAGDARVITTMATTTATALATATTGHHAIGLVAGALAMRARTPAAKPGDGATSSDARNSENSWSACSSVMGNRLPESSSRVEETRLYGAVGDVEQARDVGDAVSFDRLEHDDDAELVGKGVDRLPEARRSLALDGERFAVHAAAGETRCGVLANGATPLGTAKVDREPPRHADEPRAEALAVAKIRESAVGAGERVLGDVLGILMLPEDTERDPKCERGRIGQPRFELPGEVVCLGHEGGQSDVIHTQLDAAGPLAVRNGRAD
jgi:hypothetical protein